MDAVAQLNSALAGRYIAQRQIGAGGMATVYLARDVKHDRLVAIKVLDPHVGAMLGAERFLAEIRVTANLQHANLLPLFDSGDAGGLLFYVMPYVDGESLRQRLDKQKQLPVAEAVRIAIVVASALDYAHAHRVIHRDLKPENILLRDGQPLLADFGIARVLDDAGERLTRTGITIGTAAYMSPEQSAGERDIGAKSDIYSLGCVLYEMLAGEPPFTGPNPRAILLKQLADPVREVHRVRDSVSPALDAALARALAREPADRFPTAGAFAQALAAVDQVPANRRRSRRRMAAWIAGAGAVAAALAFSIRSRDPGAAGEIPSLAILPFTTQSADSADAYLGSGIAEELLNALADVPGIRVASRTSSFAAGASADIPGLGARLGVRNVLEGSVRRAAGTLRVTTRLVDARADREIWSAHFDTTAAAVFAVQEQIARTIVDRLRVQLARDSLTIVHHRTTNAAAHDLALRAAGAVGHLGRSTSRDVLLAGVALLDSAERLDPAYAEVPALQASIYLRLAVFRDQGRVHGEAGMGAGEMLRRARAAAQRAMRLDPGSSTAHTALGETMFRYDWDWGGAEREFRRALELKPKSADAYSSYSRFARSMGRFADARRFIDSAAKYGSAERDPRQRSLAQARVSYFSHDFPRAMAENAAADTNARTWPVWAAEALIGARPATPGARSTSGAARHGLRYADAGRRRPRRAGRHQRGDRRDRASDRHARPARRRLQGRSGARPAAQQPGVSGGVCPAQVSMTGAADR